MTLSKQRLAVATFIASVTIGSGQLAQAQVKIERPAAGRATQSAPVLVNFRPQAGGAGGAGGGAVGAVSPGQTGAAGAAGGTGAGTSGASAAGGAAALPGAASGQPSAGATGGAGGAQLGGSQIIGGAGLGGVGSDAAAGVGAGELPPAASGRLTPIIMQGVREPIGAADISVAQIGTQVIPEDQAASQIAGVLPLPGGQDRGIGYVTYRWQAANICHWPLYFEEPMLERHGQQRCPTFIQPAVSGAKFFSNIALYPYKATLWPALESRYTLGHFRPGSPAPLLRDTLPWSPRAALVQGGAVTGVVVGLPW